MFCAMIAQEMWLVVLLMVIGGFFQGSFAAGYVFALTDAFPAQSAGAASVVLMSINIAGMTAPLWMGAIGKEIGFMLPMLIICGMMTLAAVILAFAKQKKQN